MHRSVVTAWYEGTRKQHRIVIVESETAVEAAAQALQRLTDETPYSIEFRAVDREGAAHLTARFTTDDADRVLHLSVAWIDGAQET